MINAKRIAELREWLFYARQEYDGNLGGKEAADLLAILSDYEAALPLLVAVRKAAPADVDLDTCFIGRSKMFSPSMKAIAKELSAHKAYKERSGA